MYSPAHCNFHSFPIPSFVYVIRLFDSFIIYFINMMQLDLCSVGFG